MATFTSKINGNDIYAKRAEATRSGLLFETLGDKYGILPDSLANDPTSGDRNPAHVLATLKDVLDAQTSALTFKGIVDGTHPLPTSGYVKGWTYEVAAPGTYAGETCEAGDMIVCVSDFDTTAADSDWAIIQKNIDGAVTGPASSVEGQLPVFNSTTGKVIRDSGVSINKSTDTGALDGSSDAKVPTSKAVKDAITDAVSALDADVTSASGTKVQVEVVEANGIVTGVTVTETGLDTALATKADKVANAIDGNFAGLDGNGNLTDSGKKASDFKTVQAAVSDPTVPTTGTTESLSFIDTIAQDTNGVITATKKNMRAASTSQAGIVQLAGSIGATVDSENNKAASEKAVRDAINDLDVSDITPTLGANKTITALSETNGKIAATASDIAITGAQVTVTDATSGNFAGLDSNGNLTDSGKKAADFATAAQGAKADSAIQIVKSYTDVSGTATASALSLDTSDHSVTIPTATSTVYGTVIVETVDL